MTQRKDEGKKFNVLCLRAINLEKLQKLQKSVFRVGESNSKPFNDIF